MKVLVAGASGLIGREVVVQLRAQGDEVVALAHRSAVPSGEGIQSARWSELDRALSGVDAVFSAAGASVSLSLAGRAGYQAVDVPINTALIDAAERAKVPRMVYVSVAGHEAFASCRYVDAHERVVSRLRRSTLGGCVVRPTGVFGALAPVLGMARLRVVPNVGGGRVRTNPVHEVDVAAACVRALGDRSEELVIGGPEVHTRAELFDLAAAALGHRVWKVPVPIWWVRLNAALLTPFHPRIAQFTEFVAALATRDALAPAIGTRRIEDYFRALAAR